MSTADQHILDPHEAPGPDTGTDNKLMQVLLIAAIAASGLSMVFSIGTAVASASDQSPEAQVVSVQE